MGKNTLSELRRPCDKCHERESVLIAYCYTCKVNHAVCEECIDEYKRARGLVDENNPINHYDPELLDSLK